MMLCVCVCVFANLSDCMPLSLPVFVDRLSGLSVYLSVFLHVGFSLPLFLSVSGCPSGSRSPHACVCYSTCRSVFFFHSYTHLHTQTCIHTHLHTYTPSSPFTSHHPSLRSSSSPSLTKLRNSVVRKSSFPFSSAFLSSVSLNLCSLPLTYFLLFLSCFRISLVRFSKVTLISFLRLLGAYLSFAFYPLPAVYRFCSYCVYRWLPINLCTGV